MKKYNYKIIFATAASLLARKVNTLSWNIRFIIKKRRDPQQHQWRPHVLVFFLGATNALSLPAFMMSLMSKKWISFQVGITFIIISLLPTSQNTWIFKQHRCRLKWKNENKNKTEEVLMEKICYVGRHDLMGLWLRIWFIAATKPMWWRSFKTAMRLFKRIINALYITYLHIKIWGGSPIRKTKWTKILRDH